MQAAASIGPGAGPRLSWRDPALRWLLLLALALQLASWWMQRGYPLADAVEFMERAQSWVNGEPLTDARTVRSFAFSTLFVPPFLAARALGLEDQRVVLVVARLLQVALALGLVVACARLAQRVAGRSAGLATGFIVAVNPVLLTYAVHPVSGIAAALCIALGLDRLIEPGTKRDGWIGGLWFGLAFLMAYQSLLVILAVLAILVVRDRWKARASWLGLTAGLLACFAIQLVLDRVVYGQWDGSLWRYLLENAGYMIVRLLLDSGFRQTAGKLYGQIADLRGQEFLVPDASAPAMMRYGFLWYFANAPRFFVWPLIVLFVVGASRALVKPRWTTSLALVALILVLFVMGKKGAKSLRLCLPLIPLAVPLFAVGWQWLAQHGATRLLARAALLAALPLSLFVLARSDLRAHAAYWDAAQWIDEQAQEAGADAAPARVASAYDWAVFLRFSSRVEKQKLSATLDHWSVLPEEERARIEVLLGRLDWLIVHQPLLQAEPDLVRRLGPRFSVAAAFYDQDVASELGAVLVLRRARAPEERPRLVAFSAAAPKPEFERRLDFRSDDGAQQVTWLGFDLERLPGSRWWWITYHWELAPEAGQLEVRDRVSGPDETNTWQNDHPLGRGAWTPGSEERYASEGFLLVPSAVERSDEPRFRPLGGPFRRGQLIPARLWIEVRDIGRSTILSAYRPGSASPIVNEFGYDPWRWTVDGYRLSKDGLVQVGGFFLPVHAKAAVPDDGKPLPE